MKVFAVHPSALMYTKVFLRLEPLGLENVCQVIRQAGHEVRLIDLQVETERDYCRLLERWRPEVVAFSCNYLANVPEVVDLCKLARQRLPQSFVVVGGHSASFLARDFLAHAEGAIDCVLTGEGEVAMPALLEAVAHDRQALGQVPGAVSPAGVGPPPELAPDLDALQPARDLLRRRRNYFIGVLDPCASIEFSRGCPWDCAFCSAWTFYGRTYRLASPEKVVAELERICEPGVFIVDDVAFIQADQGFAIGEAIARKGIRKHFYLETRGDVLVRNLEVFKFWRTLGLEHLFIGLEAIDEDGLRQHRKRLSLTRNFEALEAARSLGLIVAVNLIVDPDWDERRFEIIRQWCLEVPEIVNLTVNTPYPGTALWHTEARRLTTRDYRLFDIQHAVLPTRLPLARFYEELVNTQQVLNQKFLGWAALRGTCKILAGHLLHGQTNFLKAIWKFNSVYNARQQFAEHALPVKYQMTLPPPPRPQVDHRSLYVHKAQTCAARALDDATEQFVASDRPRAE